MQKVLTANLFILIFSLLSVSCLDSKENTDFNLQNERLFGVIEINDIHIVLTVNIEGDYVSTFRLFTKEMTPIQDGVYRLKKGFGTPLALYISDSVVLFALGSYLTGTSIVLFDPNERVFKEIEMGDKVLGLVYYDDGFIYSEIPMGLGLKINPSSGRILEEYKFDAYRIPKTLIDTDPDLQLAYTMPYLHPNASPILSSDINEQYISNFGIKTYYEDLKN
jgi:hypothetical protein